MPTIRLQWLNIRTDKMGNVHLHGGVHLMLLSDNLSDVNKGDSSEIIASGGVTLRF